MRKLFDFHSEEGNERCGVLLKDGQIRELLNIHPAPLDSFAFSTDELLNPDVIATWHTHPRKDPNLTMDDYRAFCNYPHLSHYIVGKTEIWCFKFLGDILVLDDNSRLTR